MAKDDEKEASEASGEQGGGKSKLIIIIVAVLISIAASIGGTMFFLGFFDPPPPEEEETAEAVPAEPVKMPAMYFPIRPSFVINFQSRGRQRYLQTDVSIMTRDQSIFSALETHMPLIKNHLVMILSSELYEELQTDEGRELLRQKAMEGVQNILVQEIGREDGVEQVLFTNFVMQ